jgi:hypothetical protein
MMFVHVMLLWVCIHTEQAEKFAGPLWELNPHIIVGRNGDQPNVYWSYLHWNVEKNVHPRTYLCRQVVHSLGCSIRIFNFLVHFASIDLICRLYGTTKKFLVLKFSNTIKKCWKEAIFLACKMLCGVSVNFCTAISAGLVCPTKLPTRTSHPQNVTHMLCSDVIPLAKHWIPLENFLALYRF